MTTMRFNSVYNPVTTTTLPLRVFDSNEPPLYPQDAQNATRTLPEVPSILR